MPSAQDPFYVVKEEIQESIDKLQSTFHQWEHIPSNTGERVNLIKELLAGCESIEWQVDELDKAIAVAARDPAWYGLMKWRLKNEGDGPALLALRQQDEDLDELGASLVRIGDVGLTIHDELLGQEKILDDLGMEMDSTSNRLDFVQKKVAMVMKKAGIKGQIMMILFLVVLFIVLFVLVFLT
ncbi:syntaxin-61 [Quercus suber]|uniref:Syntaxin-61 n=1 Tax=Quercus suber TaxID=58331 RepID=A0AAW0LW61_QUESU